MVTICNVNWKECDMSRRKCDIALQNNTNCCIHFRKHRLHQNWWHKERTDVITVTEMSNIQCGAVTKTMLALSNSSQVRIFSDYGAATASSPCVSDVQSWNLTASNSHRCKYINTINKVSFSLVICCFALGWHSLSSNEFHQVTHCNLLCLAVAFTAILVKFQYAI